MTTLPAPAATAPPTGPPAAPFAHMGLVRELALIGLVNLLLKALTLGVFHFWAKTRVRRYVWRHTLYARQPFEYTGRGLELALGYALALALLAALGALVDRLVALLGHDPALATVAGLLFWPMLLFLAGFARYSARRYLLGHTRWNELRFALVGSAREHGLETLLGGALAVVSLGLYLPILRNRLAAHLVNTAWCGAQRFRYEGGDGPLLRRYLAGSGIALGILVAWGALLALAAPFLARFLRAPLLPPFLELVPAAAGLLLMLLALPALWLAWLWYRAGELRHFVAHTRLGNVRFSLALPTARYVWLHASNAAALALSLGLAYPWVVVRTVRLLTRSLQVHGELELLEVATRANAPPLLGEGLADLLDLGGI